MLKEADPQSADKLRLLLGTWDWTATVHWLCLESR